VASSHAATALAVLTLAEAGDNIVSSLDLYGRTVHFFRERLKQFGIGARFVDPSDPGIFAARPTTARAFTSANRCQTRSSQCSPLRKSPRSAVRLVFPSSSTTRPRPLAIRPFDHRATVVIYSATKHIGGRGTTIGGAIVDSGQFPWAEFPERQPLIHRPDPGYGHRSYLQLAELFGPIAFVLRARAALLRDLGSSLAPQNAFQLLQGLETLPLRIQRQFDNAARVADFLATHPKVAKVIYPGLQTGLDQKRAEKYLTLGYGGLVGFESKGGEKVAFRFIDRLKLFYHLANIGDVRSLAINPSSTTHGQLNPEQQAAAGISPAFVRLSIGIEDANDIIADIAQALDEV
jgi:O-acetylhomoserine (thiol)-lyase